MHSHLPTIEPWKWLWSSRCMLKIMVFAWLLFFDRLNTKDLLVRRHWHDVKDDNLCVLCHQQIYEDQLHLFFSCNFSARIWNYLQIDWSRDSDVQQCISLARRRFAKVFFFEVVFTTAWNIWIIRNGKTFKGERATFRAWHCKFVHDLTLLSQRVKASVRPQLLSWLEGLP